MFPPLPDWDALHPIVVHFPIALLSATPLLIIVGLLLPKTGRSYYIAALIVMIVGVAAAWIAVNTGEAAGKLVDRVPPVGAVLERHEELAETTSTVFTVLAIVFAAVVFGPSLLKKPLSRMVNVLIFVVFLLVYLGCTSLIARTAHQGGLLVHEYGVHAMLPLGDEPLGEAPTDDD